MGRRLEALEQRAGATLLQKTPAGYVLTPSGEAVFATVERIEAEALAVERLIAGKDLRLEGTVRLTTVETLAAEVLSPVLAAFRLTHPAVQVEVVAGTRSLSVAPFTQPDVVAQKIGEIAYGLYASAAYLARGGPPTLILTEPDLLDTPEMRWLLSVVPDAGAAVVSNSRLVHRAAARDGMGLACLARYLGDAEPGLVRLPAPKGMPPAPVRDLWLGVHGDMRHMPRIRSFLDALRSGLRQAAGRLRPAG
jgi:DNA-binding transcriptional LysR family regulator